MKAAHNPVRSAADGPGDDERLCREVITRVNRWLQVKQPARATEVVARLEAELERHRARDGVLRLPD